MAIIKRIYNVIFTFYVYFYVLLYLGYILYIILAHSSYSLVSISAIVLPFILLLSMILILWKSPGVRNNRSEKNNLRSLAIFSVIPFSVCLILLGINEHKTTFTPEKWVDDSSERVYIVDDLLSTYELDGKSKSEIVTLLGSPTDTEYFKSENNVVYYLGDERGMISIDSEWLVIEFDDNQTVKEYDVRTD